MTTLNAQGEVGSYSLLCTRLFVQTITPAYMDELPLLYCCHCELAYLVICDDPAHLGSITEWETRIISISDAISLEHEEGHLSTHFVHDGVLKGYHRRGLFDAASAWVL